jgi:hypothetical protein
VEFQLQHTWSTRNVGLGFGFYALLIFGIRTFNQNEQTNGERCEMRKIPLENEVDIIKSVLGGETYGEVAARNGVVKSTVNRVVEDVRRVMPDFDEIRSLLVRFKRCGLTVADVERALCLKEKLDSLGLSLDGAEVEAVALEEFEVARVLASIAVDSLLSQNRTIVATNRDLSEKNVAMQLLDEALTTGTVKIACKTCQQQFTVGLETCEYYEGLMRNGHVLHFRCPNCGFVHPYAPSEILSYFALCLLRR